MNTDDFDLWDIPTRLFHWAVALGVVLAWVSAELQWYEVHEYTGYSLIVAVVFRLVWGVIGSRHSRFTDFVVGPAGLSRYLRTGQYDSAGHNPLGALSVLALLLVLLLQGVSGLFNSDDILFSGPLHYWASTELRDAMGLLHDVLFNLLLALVVLHIGAVVYHQRRHSEPLVKAMILGRAPGRAGRQSPVAWWLALPVVAVLAALLWWGLAQAPQPQPFF
jgi:cytochrome b